MERLRDHLFKEQEPPAAFSSHSSCMRREEVKSLQIRKDASFTSCHGFSRRFFPAVPQEHLHHLYWKTQHMALLIKKKQPQTKGGTLLFWADLISMSCSGKFVWVFFCLVELWQLFHLLYNAVIGQEYHHSGSSVTGLLLPRSCIFRQAERDVT